MVVSYIVAVSFICKIFNVGINKVKFDVGINKVKFNVGINKVKYSMLESIE
jgi:hypothetical protein